VAVENEENVGGDKADALVPIDERVVLDEAKPVGGCKVGKVRVRFVSPSMLGSSHSRVQQAFIAKSQLPTMGPDLIGVRCLDGGTWDPGG